MIKRGGHRSMQWLQWDIKTRWEYFYIYETTIFFILMAETPRKSNCKHFQANLFIKKTSRMINIGSMFNCSCMTCCQTCKGGRQPEVQWQNVPGWNHTASFPFSFAPLPHIKTVKFENADVCDPLFKSSWARLNIPDLAKIVYHVVLPDTWNLWKVEMFFMIISTTHSDPLLPLTFYPKKQDYHINGGLTRLTKAYHSKAPFHSSLHPDLWTSHTAPLCHSLWCACVVAAAHLNGFVFEDDKSVLTMVFRDAFRSIWMTVSFEGFRKNDGGVHVKLNLVYTQAYVDFFIRIIRTDKRVKRPKSISLEAWL